MAYFFSFDCLYVKKKMYYSHFSVHLLEGRILFINFKVDLSCSDGQSASSHHHRSYQLGWSTQNYRAWGGGEGCITKVLRITQEDTDGLLMQRRQKASQTAANVKP